MSTATPEAPKKNRTVLDQHGQSYELTGRIGEGGQGIVCTTNYPNVLVKVARATTEEKRVSWTSKIRALMRQPLEGLPIAHPQALITQPQPGYVMELMDGLAPMTELMQVATDALMSDEGLSGYVKTGGLLRRLKMLARLARVLADLHGRGLAYGDLSPANVFVSQSLEYAEVWLIDADNVASQSRDGQQGVFTPDYGAPEILRGESGINTLTDSWSFAVMAYRILTLVHPLKGDVVLEGEPEREEAALRGELPWVDHPVDRSNALSIGLPREITLNAPLRALFERCFNAGLNNPGERPCLNEWADAFEAATGHCDQCESCGSTFFYTSKHICPFCDHAQDTNRTILLQEYRYMPPDLLREGLPEDVPESLIRKECWTRTGKAMVLSMSPTVLKTLPLGTSLYADARPLCTVELAKDGLWIEPSVGTQVSLQRASDDKVVAVVRRQRLKSDSRSGVSFWLHLGAVEEEHVVWRFNW
ncbi:protein kinase-like protein [Kerstersia gyiorum]|uniref:Protein kinase-like protein n=1 Tax=Kerstersia gyiorum TaxID=206506 RepID=A0A4Q7MPF8_9BURK|nr:protein kinase [Kerstersia gyiorum]KAB0544391.1 protein kinase [Kerstersia gyiorum]RZS69508.1 protein kinase-like protein [Kerstersia gyiorum]